jgi:1,2-dihydroxy-3-keto-5-methylthiopentene dioxygenase
MSTTTVRSGTAGAFLGVDGTVDGTRIGRTAMSLLITWNDHDPSTPLRQTTDPAEIAAVYEQFGGRFERHELRAGIRADTAPDAVLAAYRDVVDALVAAEGFVTVDVASVHPSDDPDWADTAKAVRGRFIDEHTHGDDDEIRFMVRGAGVFFLHIGDKVHGVYSTAGDLLGVPRGTTHWFDCGPAPDFTAIRFFHDPRGWVGIPTGSDISARFPDFDDVRARARDVGGA